MATVKYNSNQIGFLGLLTIVFITLKLTHYINWSWFWVLSPIIFSILFWLVIILIIILTVKFNK
jgi:magnesium-transporting ATPase (P-type)